ncbi:Six-hairpin glycosidase-like protein [Cokeromyces recurvatus]|uniref:Six-hairpin glycosidase-like protein n=1 Tax=Cokeromyces recurvatus TaxID=90255 RepID=UPI00221E3E71|nr:Six-hairpin glycosidase-like protein [Cokeromyces recurvatus]KAI7908245.1 Six-hairpin glycosidase-like protein [Cokeromyces recurvatus]
MGRSIESTYTEWRKKYVKSYKDGLYVYYKESNDGGSEVTVSEAHGYGMLISVLRKNRQDFDGFFNYFKNWKNKNGLMQWQQKKGKNGELVPGDEGGENCATDGDIDIATALFLAAKVWGKNDYFKAACDLAGAIWKHCFNHSTYLPLLGDWADPGDKEYNLTRPSDFILSAYLLFYYEDKERQQYWGRVVNAVITTCQYQLTLHPQTGLIADFLQLDRRSKQYKPVTGQVLEDKHDGDYNWNSCRVPWRLAHYYMLTKDERLKPLLETLSKFFEGVLKKGGNSNESPIRAGYYLNGKAFVDYSDMAFNAPVSFLFWVLNDQAPLDQIMKYIDNDKDGTYFGETIATLCFLQAHVPY